MLLLERQVPLDQVHTRLVEHLNAEILPVRHQVVLNAEDPLYLFFIVLVLILALFRLCSAVAHGPTDPAGDATALTS